MKYVLIRYYLFLLTLGLIFLPDGNAAVDTYDAKKAPSVWEQIEIRSLSLDSFSGFRTGYDSNVRLDNARKGSMFEEVSYFIKGSALFEDTVTSALSYYLNALLYNDYNDYSNVVNRVTWSLKKKVQRVFSWGGGAEAVTVIYPYRSVYDYVYGKPYMFAEYAVNSALSVRTEYGKRIRVLTHQEPLEGDQLYGDGKRRELQDIFSSLLLINGHRWSVRPGIDYILSDSNDRFQDYYDYTAVRPFLLATVSLTRRIGAITSFWYEESRYKERQVVAATEKEKDRTFTGKIAVSYALTEDTSFETRYSYSCNRSNEPSQEYIQSVISCGITHHF